MENSKITTWSPRLSRGNYYTWRAALNRILPAFPICFRMINANYSIPNFTAFSKSYKVSQHDIDNAAFFWFYDLIGRSSTKYKLHENLFPKNEDGNADYDRYISLAIDFRNRYETESGRLHVALVNNFDKIYSNEIFSNSEYSMTAGDGVKLLKLLMKLATRSDVRQSMQIQHEFITLSQLSVHHRDYFAYKAEWLRRKQDYENAGFTQSSEGRYAAMFLFGLDPSQFTYEINSFISSSDFNNITLDEVFDQFDRLVRLRPVEKVSIQSKANESTDPVSVEVAAAAVSDNKKGGRKNKKRGMKNSNNSTALDDSKTTTPAENRTAKQTFSNEEKPSPTTSTLTSTSTANNKRVDHTAGPAVLKLSSNYDDIDPNAVYLDNGATIHLMQPRFCRNIIERSLARVKGVSGDFLETTRSGTWMDISGVLISEQTPINILSQRLLRRQYYLTMLPGGSEYTAYGVNHTLTFTEDDKIGLYKLTGIGEAAAGYPLPLKLNDEDDDEYNNVLFCFHSNTVLKRMFSSDTKSKYSSAQINKARLALEFHSIMGHPNDDVLKRAFEHGVYSNCSLTPRDVDNMRNIFKECLTCEAQNSVTLSYPSSDHPPASAIGDMLVIDIVPLKEMGMDYRDFTFLVSVDEYSGHLMAVELPTKGNDQIVKSLEIIISYYKRFGHTVKRISADAELTLNTISTKMGMEGISVTNYSPGMKAVRVERYVRTFSNHLAKLKNELNFECDKTLLKQLFLYTILTLNNLPNSMFPLSCPHTVVTGVKPDLNDIFKLRFGSVVSAHDPNAVKNNDYGIRSRIGIFVGYDLQYPGSIKVYCPLTKDVFRRKQYKVLQTMPSTWPLKYQVSMSPPDTQITTKFNLNLPSPVDKSVGTDDDVPDIQDHSIQDCVMGECNDDCSTGTLTTAPMAKELASDIAPVGHNTVTVEGLQADNIIEKIGNSNNATTLSPSSNTTRARPQRRAAMPGVHKAFAKSVNIAQVIDSPNADLAYFFHFSLRDGLSDPAIKMDTHAATMKELLNMQNKQVFEFVDYNVIPKSERYKIMRSQLIVNKKFKPTGELDKIKSRLIVLGNMQSPDTYGATYAPTINKTTLFTVLQLAVNLGCTLDTIDFPAAFLNSVVPKGKDIFMELPKDVTTFMLQNDLASNAMLSANGKLYVKLCKYLYGLHESAMEWYLCLSEALEAIGYVKSKSDPCLFTLCRNGKYSFITLHVDDILFATNSHELRQFTVDALIQRFGNITYNADSTSFLGMNITRTTTGVALDQHGFLQDLVEENGITTTRPSPSVDSLFTEKLNSPRCNEVDSKWFLSTVMSLMYAATLTRPDIIKEITF